MSESSRSTQDQGHGTVGGAQHARTLALVASGVPYAAALDAPRVESASQGCAKPVAAEQVYCSRPAGSGGLWRCALPFSHVGDHVPMNRPDLLVEEVIRLREERETALSLLRTAGKLLRSIQSYGNPGHSFRQDIADQIDALLKEAK